MAYFPRRKTSDLFEYYNYLILQSPGKLLIVQSKIIKFNQLLNNGITL